ncbi:hypothetical protein L1887_50655 [Cichorium endivia]|nr:hypothetical protein L1887_50655 [Cichorium endivia]
MSEQVRLATVQQRSWREPSVGRARDDRLRLHWKADQGRFEVTEAEGAVVQKAGRRMHVSPLSFFWDRRLPSSRGARLREVTDTARRPTPDVEEALMACELRQP